MNHGTTKEEPVRLLFEMTREDNPRLYDDLIRFNKGTKRVNRLRFLAHEGAAGAELGTDPCIRRSISNTSSGIAYPGGREPCRGGAHGSGL
jgi:hypothetical protein